MIHAISNPIELFREWYELAERSDFVEPSAMTLATVSAAGRPSARMVLLKGFDNAGFVFFTNYVSRKGKELQHSQSASLVLWWDRLFRQVRIEGRVELVSAYESDAYFATRPRDSQLSAIASRQSAVIADRAVLEQRMSELTDRYQGRTVPRPDYWGGYRLVPDHIEFWQGRESRLHDRLVYRRSGTDPWIREWLSP